MINESSIFAALSPLRRIDTVIDTA